MLRGNLRICPETSGAVVTSWFQVIPPIPIPQLPSSVRGGIFVFSASAAVDTLRVFQLKACRVDAGRLK